MLINILVQTLKCVETLILHLFYRCKHEKDTLKSEIDILAKLQISLMLPKKALSDQICRWKITFLFQCFLLIFGTNLWLFSKFWSSKIKYIPTALLNQVDSCVASLFLWWSWWWERTSSFLLSFACSNFTDGADNQISQKNTHNEFWHIKVSNIKQLFSMNFKIKIVPFHKLLSNSFHLIIICNWRGN